MYELNYYIIKWTWDEYFKIHDIYHWTNLTTNFTSRRIEWLEDDEWFKCYTRIW